MAERPTPQGHYLGQQLARFRNERGMTLRVVSDAVGFSEAKLSRMEGGRSRIFTADVVKLLDLYDVTPEQRRHLLDFTALQESRPTGWWPQSHGGHDNGSIFQILSLEAVATQLYTIEPALIPGLLQSQAYARVALRSLRDGGIPREVEFRIARKRRLYDGELTAEFLIGETAIRLIPAEAREEQLAHLLDMAALPNVTVKLIPEAEIAYLTHGCPILLLDFDLADMPSIAYVEHWMRSWVVNDPTDVERARERYGMVSKSCLSEHDTLAWISAQTGV